MENRLKNRNLNDTNQIILSKVSQNELQSLIISLSPLIIKDRLNTMDGTINTRRVAIGAYESSVPAGKPTGAGGMILSIYNSGTSGVQLTVTNAGEMYTRIRNSSGNSWDSWVLK